MIAGCCRNDSCQFQSESQTFHCLGTGCTSTETGTGAGWLLSEMWQDFRLAGCPYQEQRPLVPFTVRVAERNYFMPKMPYFLVPPGPCGLRGVGQPDVAGTIAATGNHGGYGWQARLETSQTLSAKGSGETMKKLLLCLPVLLASVCWSQTVDDIPLYSSSCHVSSGIATLSATWKGPVPGMTCTINKSKNLANATCMVGVPAGMTSHRTCHEPVCCWWFDYWPYAEITVDVNPPVCSLDFTNPSPWIYQYQCDEC